MSDVLIYTKTGCPYCAAARKFYSDQGIAFDEINVTEKPEEMEKVLQMTGGKRIVPVIMYHGELKIGFGGG